MSQLIEAVAAHYMKNDENALRKTTRNISVRLDVDVLAQVEFVGKQLGLNRSQTVQLLLEESSHDALIEIARLQTAGKDENSFKDTLADFYQQITCLEAQYDHEAEEHSK